VASLAVLAAVLVPGTAAARQVSCANANSRPVQPVAVPSDVPWAIQRYGLARLAALADGTGQTVAVVDSGVDPTHPQLAGAVAAGRDFLDVGQSDGRVDCVGHGTAVASVIAARPVKGTSFQGLAPGATIVPVRVSELQDVPDGSPAGRTTNAAGFAAAIRAAVDLHVTVINISLTFSQDDPDLHAAIDYALRANVVVVAAAGNRFDSGNPTPYPAAYPGVIGVGAIGPDGKRLPGSQVGDYVDIVAPGSQIVASALPRGYAVMEGTSFAAPFVAATAALLRQYRPELSAVDVAARLTATADPAPGTHHGGEYGAGVLNPYRALTDNLGAPPRSLAPVRPAPPDPNAEVLARTAARTRTWSLGLTAAGLLLAGLVLLAAAALPRGRRRGWRPGVRSVPDDDAAPAPPPEPGARATR
jgi:type VII secretion-associated serine protease mycosin